MLNPDSFDQEKENVQGEKAKMEKQRQAIKQKFIVICVGAVLLLCGYSACFVLQTSVNIKAGLGKSSRSLFK